MWGLYMESTENKTELDLHHRRIKKYLEQWTKYQDIFEKKNSINFKDISTTLQDTEKIFSKAMGSSMVDVKASR